MNNLEIEQELEYWYSELDRCYSEREALKEQVRVMEKRIRVCRAMIEDLSIKSDNTSRS